MEAGSEDTWGTSPNQLEISPVPEYLFPKSSTQMIDREDLYLFTLKELRFGRNEIYARHGKEFQSPELTEYFSGKNWYKEALAAGPFDESMLNETELANIKLLAAVEEERSNDLGPHAEEQANPYLIDETAPVDVIQEIEIFDEQCGRPSDFVKAEAAGPAAYCDLRNYLPSTGAYTTAFRNLGEDGILGEECAMLTRSICLRNQDESMTEQVWEDSQYTYYNNQQHMIRRIWWDDTTDLLMEEMLAQQGYGKVSEPTIYLGRPGTRIMTGNSRGAWGGQREYTTDPDYYTVETSGGIYEKCLLMSYNAGTESVECQFFAPGKGIICRWSNDSGWTGSVVETSTTGVRGGESSNLNAYREFMKKNYTTGRNSTLLADLTGDGREELIVVSSEVWDENGKPLNEASEQAKEMRKLDEEAGRSAWPQIFNTVSKYPQSSPYPSMVYTNLNSQIEIRVYTREEGSGRISCLYESDACSPHPGWNWLYLYEEDGRDYLMKYTPSMWQGYGGYDYKIFSLQEDGQEQILRAEEEIYGRIDVEGEEREQQWDRMERFLNQVEQYRSKSIPLVEIGNDHFDVRSDWFEGRDFNYAISCDELGMTPSKSN